MSKARNIAAEPIGGPQSREGREGIVYARVSSKRQEVEGSGLQSQEGRCVARLRELGISHVKSFHDSFSGAGDFMARPAMKELLEYVDAHPHKKFIVVFDDLKRLARDAEFHLKLRRAMFARDVALECLNFNFDESPEGRFLELIMAGQADLEREQNRRQVIQKQKARLDAGYWPFGAKKGYLMKKDALHGKIAVPLEPECTILRDALERYSVGMFPRKIDACRYLVEQGFWSKQSPEKYIDKFTRILSDPFYMGDIEYEAWEVKRRKGHHAAIISVETFEKNRVRLIGERTGKKIRADMSADFPLRGLITCGQCGSHLTGGWSKGRKKKYPFYKCQLKECPMKGKSLRKKDVESSFEYELQRNVLRSEIEPLVKLVYDRVWKEEMIALELEKKQQKKEILTLEEKVSNLTEMSMVTKSIAVRSIYEQEIEVTLRKKYEIESRSQYEIDPSIPYRTILGQVIGLLKRPLPVWKSLSLLEQHRLFYFIFEQKLPYDRELGYRTAEISSLARLFGEFVEQKPPLVEMGRIELPSESRSRPGFHA